MQIHALRPITDREQMAQKYVYGPVKSRRLGTSLGVDIVPMKTCSFDCVYCQLGGGFPTTVRRDSFVPVETVLAQIKDKLSSRSGPDYITLGGSGETTLSTDFGKIAASIKEIYGIPVCLLTNGALLWMDEVLEDCAQMDIIVPNLDACDEETFQRMNRPHPSLSFENVVKGLVRLREKFCGNIWLEIFLVPGINDSQEQIRAFKRLTEDIRPDKIQLNTAVRPPAEKSVRAIEYERLENICSLLGPKAEVIIPDPEQKKDGENISEADIIDLLKRRPCTSEDMASTCKNTVDDVAEMAERLVAEGKVKVMECDGKKFFKV